MSITFLPITKTARISTLGEANAETSEILIVLHGYRQLAANFIRYFQGIEKENRLIIAPEALSRFYVEGYTGKVGASWMTKEDREWEIHDQTNYLNQVVAHFQELCPNAKIHLFGFSQGVATAWRWFINGNADIQSLTTWCGQIPPEFPENLKQKLSEIPFRTVYATHDEFAPVPYWEQQNAALREFFPHLQTFHFEGTHTLNAAVLKEIYG